MSISPFFGKETEPAAAASSRPLRTWNYFDATGEQPRSVEAHYLRFEAHHVTFWRDRPEPNIQDTLILAEINSAVTELTEDIA